MLGLEQTPEFLDGRRQEPRSEDAGVLPGQELVERRQFPDALDVLFFPWDLQHPSVK